MSDTNKEDRTTVTDNPEVNDTQVLPVVPRTAASDPIDTTPDDDRDMPTVTVSEDGLTMDHKHHIPGWVVIAIVIGVCVGALLIASYGSSRTATAPQPTVTTSTAAAPTPSKPRVTNGNVDLTGLVDQKWSNAKRILKARGAGLDAIVTLTDDGKSPVIDSNWTVTEVSRGSDGVITIKLKHDQSSTTDDIGGVAGQLKDKVSGAWNNLSDGSMGLGKHPNGD